MLFTQAIASAILLFAATGLTAPVPQLAGEGAAANSILSGTDNAVGYGVEDAEDNLAGNVATAKAAVPAVPRMFARQLAGEGAAADSILSGTDNAVGYGVEDAEDNIAADITDAKGGSTTTGGGSNPPPPPPPQRKRQLAGEGAAANSVLSGTDNAVGYGTEDAEDNLAGNVATVKAAVPAAKRQLDKVAAGAQAVSDAAGTGSSTSAATTAAESDDGSLTSGAANAGQTVADIEVATAEGAGKSVPKSRRQLDKISNGAQAIGDAAGVGSTTAPATSAGDSIDGTLTSGAANAGAQVADTEVSTAESVGKSVPKSRRQLDKISNGAQAIGNAAGVGSTTAPATSAGDSIDGTLTSGAANAGAQVADTEVSTAESVGKSVPRRFRA
ncbi:hypothetical protein B0A48_10630 [Cryoendolithus antarcticus]|uniref:Uncharacterized protein n=1 Tax=Cryoendolithus antarcticus TaxID=1507870 RepID=A0A1V8SXV4_9PEZI|nr:hypothetical protein B0A48_10630 [Cryoendolithus antarcticus]